MAILEFGVIVTAARGTVGGLILSANKSGPYAKIWAKGSNPQSQLQTAQRALIASFAQSWQGITAGQRTDWDNYAALPAQDLINSLGQTYSISGFLWYVRINSNLANAGQASRADSPTIAIPATPTISAAFLKTDDAPTESRLEIDGSDSTIDDVHVVTARLYNSEGRVAGNFNLSSILVQVPDLPPSSDLTYTADAQELVATPAINFNDDDLAVFYFFDKSLLPAWVEGTLPAARVPTAYRIHPRVFLGSPLGPPKSWVFQYWNGASFTDLDTITDFTAWTTDWSSFDVSDPLAATSTIFRLNLTDTDAGTFVNIAEIEFKGFDPSLGHPLDFQTELQTRLGTIQLGQKAFYRCAVQNAHGRRGPVASATALAENA